MSLPLLAAIVRIFNKDGAVVGTGFLVGESTVLTCAHVVADALGISEKEPEPPNNPVSLDFPLMAVGEQRTTKVIFWHPVQESGGGDIAVLQIENRLPDGVQEVRLVMADDLWGHTFRTFGFPAYHDSGVWASGRLLAREATGWIQIEDPKTTGKRVQPGFSGGAVWDEQLDGVVGMVVAADEDSSKVAYIIPTNVLLKVYPALHQQAIPPCPYRGLFAFREEDAPFFFGRDTFIQQLVNAIRKKRLLAVVGSSGSGKSSVVFAGLVPFLRRETNWIITAFRPGTRPFRSLASTLLPLMERQMSETDRLLEINKLAGQLQEHLLSLQDVVEAILESNEGFRLLLVIDQFEELYTLCQDVALRQSFLNELLTALKAFSLHGSPNFNLILILRADFIGQALSHRPLADALQYADLKLGPMNEEELQETIRRPSQKLNVKIEDGLIERILNDVSREMNALPLLEFALTLLWAKQRNGKLSHAAYEEIGGVAKALSRHAEDVYGELNEEEQRCMQQLLVQLVRPGEGTEDTRRLATRAEIGEDNWGMVLRLSSTTTRLVVSGRDQVSGEETVEIIHEALIRDWQRLRTWMEAHHEFRVWQERLRALWRQWEASGKDDGALLRGALLREAERWTVEQQEAISQLEQAFIETSKQRQQEDAQRWKKLYEEAEQQRLKAEKQQQIALARQLAAQAEVVRQEMPSSLQRSVLLAVEAIRRYPSAEADYSLRQGLALLMCPSGHMDHEDPVETVVFSPDGRYLATTNEKFVDMRWAWLWEVSSGRQVARLDHEDTVEMVVFSPDSHYVVTVSQDSTACVWEVPSGQEVMRITSVTSAAFSPDSHYLATVNEDPIIHMWKVSGEQKAMRIMAKESVTSVAYSPDGRYLAAAGTKSAQVWKVSSRRQVTSISLEDQVKFVIFSPDGRYLALAGTGNTVWLWETLGGQQVASLVHEFTFNNIVFSPDGRYLATAGNDYIARLWEVSTGRLATSMAHLYQVFTVAFSPDGRYLATASWDYTARVWEVPTGREVARVGDQARMMKAAVFSPDGHYLATAWGGAAQLWNANSSHKIKRMKHGGRVAGAVFSPDGRYLATGQNYLWEVSSGRQVASLSYKNNVNDAVFDTENRYLVALGSEDNTVFVQEALSGQQVIHIFPRTPVQKIIFSPDGRYLATIGSGQVIDLWDVSRGQLITSITHENSLQYLLFSPDSRYIAITESGQTTRLWDVTGGQHIASISHAIGVKRMIFSPDSRYLAGSAQDVLNIFIGIWDAMNGQEISRISCEGEEHDFIFSPDGRSLVTSSPIQIWEVASGQEVAHITVDAVVYSVAFSPDGRYLASGSFGNLAQIWDITTGREVSRLTHEGPVYTVAFSRDGRYLATTSEDGTAQVWLCHPEDLIAEAGARLTRNLTQEEWHRYLDDEPYHKTYPHLSTEE